MEFIIQKAVELGVHQVIPVAASMIQDSTASPAVSVRRIRFPNVTGRTPLSRGI